MNFSPHTTRPGLTRRDIKAAIKTSKKSRGSMKSSHLRSRCDAAGTVLFWEKNRTRRVRLQGGRECLCVSLYGSVASHRFESRELIDANTLNKSLTITKIGFEQCMFRLTQLRISYASFDFEHDQIVHYTCQHHCSELNASDISKLNHWRIANGR